MTLTSREITYLLFFICYLVIILRIRIKRFRIFFSFVYATHAAAHISVTNVMLNNHYTNSSQTISNIFFLLSSNAHAAAHVSVTFYLIFSNHHANSNPTIPNIFSLLSSNAHAAAHMQRGDICYLLSAT